MKEKIEQEKVFKGDYFYEDVYTLKSLLFCLTMSFYLRLDKET